MAEFPRLTLSIVLALIVLHLSAVPDFIAYYNAVPFPFSTVFGTLYHKDVVSGNFSYRGSFSCDSVTSCLRRICWGASNHTGPAINNICLQPILEVAAADTQCLGEQYYSYALLIYLSLIGLELTILLVWLWETLRPDDDDGVLKKGMWLVLYTIVLLTGPVTLIVSMRAMAASHINTLWYTIGTLSVRFILTVILSVALLLT